MKIIRVLSVVICVVLFTACSDNKKIPEYQTETVTSETVITENIKAVWLTCYELSDMLEQGTEEDFTDKIEEFFGICIAKNVNTVFVHVRPFCDSFYPSVIFEWSEFSKSASGKTPDFDPLKIIVDYSNNYGVSVHAWINPYRVSYDNNIQIDHSIGDFAFRCEDGVFLDPSSLEAQKMVLDGVREILENYNVDGIHIDDYFYPQTSEKFDEHRYNSYRENGGNLSVNNWRRENVNSLVSAMYSLVHSLKPNAVFSISPTGDIVKNKQSHYADVELWCSVNGYADWIIPQLYYGFEHDKMPFEKTADKWLKLTENSNVKLVCGLASYKQGQKDILAGNGREEWIKNKDVIERQAEYVIGKGYDGYALFSYSFL